MATVLDLANNDAEPATCLLIRTQTSCSARLVFQNLDLKTNKAGLFQLHYKTDCETHFLDIQSKYEQPQKKKN